MKKAIRATNSAQATTPEDIMDYLKQNIRACWMRYDGDHIAFATVKYFGFVNPEDVISSVDRFDMDMGEAIDLVLDSYDHDMLIDYIKNADDMGVDLSDADKLILLHLATN